MVFVVDLLFHGEYLNQVNGTQGAEEAGTFQRPYMIPLTYANFRDLSQRQLIIGQSTGMYVIFGQAANG